MILLLSIRVYSCLSNSNCTNHTKQKNKKKKLLRKRNYVKLESMFSKHEYLLNIDYFVIPELNVEASAYNAVFAQIIVKR